MTHIDSKQHRHLFILSGQSNMQRLKVAQSFTPLISAALGAENILVIKEAWGGQAIRRWCKNSAALADTDKHGDLYERLITRVHKAINGLKLLSITFVWMQGEEDASEALASSYQANLEAVIAQLKHDLPLVPERFFLVVGQLNNYGLTRPHKEYWQAIKTAQALVTENHSAAVLVSTADIEVCSDELHFSTAGYHELGQRFANAALAIRTL